MIAVVQDTTPSASSDSKLFFALGADGAAWYRTWSGSSWANTWMSLGGKFASQPAAVSFSATQTNVWVVDRSFVMQSMAYKNGTWDSTWLDMGGDISAPPTSCSPEPGVLNIFVRNISGGLYQMNWNESSGLGYSPWQSLDGWLSSSPIVTCAGPDRTDVVLYGDLQHPLNFFVRRLTNDQWADYRELGGDFIGDPTAVSVSADRTDYFGIATDGTMHHLVWTTNSGFQSWENLGGDFESSPHAIVVNASRIDVLGVGKNDQLQHKALIESTWSSDWDDLGGSFNSAPVSVLGSTGDVNVFGLAHDGSMFHGSWTIGSSSAVWSAGSGWINDGGTLSTKWFRPGPIA
jgi:hypothetical protein